MSILEGVTGTIRAKRGGGAEEIERTAAVKKITFYLV